MLVRTGSWTCGESGAVTAEAAVVLPVLAVVTVALAWMVSIGVVQARAQDAAREAARVVARGESPGVGSALARRVAVDGSRVQISAGGREVEVTVRSPVRGPGGLFRVLAHTVVTARSVAAVEDRGGAAEGLG